MATQPQLISETPTTALATIEQFTPIELFRDGKLRSIVDRIKAEVRAVDTDISTEAGRKAIASLAYKVSRSKTFIEEQRVKLVADEKKRLAAIDAEGRAVREELDALRDEVRKPLTDWENAEKDRIRSHETMIQVMADISGGVFTSLDNISRAETLLAETWNRNFEEFTKRAAQSHEKALLHLQSEKKRLTAAEEARVEQERKRAEAEEKARVEREERIAREAREKAEAEAKRREEALAREAKQREEEQARLAAEEKARLERERQAADERARQAEADRVAAAEKAERDRIAAEKKAADELKAAQAKAERERVLAVEAERKRVADEEAAKENERKLKAAEDEKRAKDKEHRAAIHREILSDIGMALNGNADGDSEVLRRVISAIAKGKVRHVTISY